jgi:acetoin utilization deacetylase AcuC-like enzyme
VQAVAHDESTLLAVHDQALVEFLRTAWQEWSAADLPSDRVVPYFFAREELTGGRPATPPTAVWARPGLFAYDTMTLIGPGTWEAARGALDAAVTAARLVAGGAPAAYALCRPPGHHATRCAFGGSCYLNNTAAAAAALRDAVGEPVGVLDIDAHHGNGTQAIFYDDPGVLAGSVHVDPGAGWFPHFLGFAAETGAGANRNVPLAPGAGDAEWLAAIGDLLGWLAGANALVVALGVDAAAGDPESPLNVTPEGFRAAGRAIGAAGKPTVLVQEGGYDLDTIGALVHETLAGFEEGRGD